MNSFRHILLAACALMTLAATAQQPDPIIAAIDQAYQQAKANTKKNKDMGNEMETTIHYTVYGNGKTTEKLHFYFNTVQGTFLLNEGDERDPHFLYYPLYLVTRDYNIGKKKYCEEFLFDPTSQRLLFAQTQDYDERGVRFDRRYYFTDGNLYRVDGPQPTALMQDIVVYQADELRHAFDWLLRNPKE